MLKSLLKKRAEGFTLVELMIVVAIIGVLAALAIYGVSRYLKHSKTAEATRNLGSMETGSKNQYQQDTDSGGAGTGPYIHVFCPQAPASLPATVAEVKGKKVSTIGSWTAATWTCLKFSINEPHFYLYNYQSNAPASDGLAALYTATANGDLDGNGVTSQFQLIGQGSNSGDAQRNSLKISNEDE